MNERKEEIKNEMIRTTHAHTRRAAAPNAFTIT